jgi:WD40 repeat protein
MHYILLFLSLATAGTLGAAHLSPKVKTRSLLESAADTALVEALGGNKNLKNIVMHYLIDPADYLHLSCQKEITRHDRSISKLTGNKSGTLLIAAVKNIIYFYTFDGTEAPKPIEEETGTEIIDISISENSQYLLTHLIQEDPPNEYCHLRKLPGGKPIKMIAGVATLSSQGKFVAYTDLQSDTYDGILACLSSGQEKLLKGHTRPITDKLFVDGDTKLLTVSTDGTMRTWSTLSGACLDTIQLDDLEPESQHFLSLESDLAGNHMAITNQTTKKTLLIHAHQQTNPQVIDHSNIFPLIKISPDGTFFAYTIQRHMMLTEQHSIIIQERDQKTVREGRVLQGHTGNIYALVISPDTRYLLTLALDGSTKLWDRKTGFCLKTFKKPEFPVKKGAFIGGKIALGTENNHILVYGLDSELESALNKLSLAQLDFLSWLKRHKRESLKLTPPQEALFASLPEPLQVRLKPKKTAQNII